VKPFDVDELLARLRAVVRRKAGAAQPVLSNGVISLDPSTFEASVEGRVAVLSPREFSLLHALLQKPGMILSRHILEEKIYG
ncbi:response regulator transcription factor, partial [Enterococcus faecalis]|uniref:response regulator transcription factor n=1 Tax=Enterococcus faecalis TaxID=1351 RepID=UPI00403F0981